MKIVITEEQKNKLFVPRKLDERQEQLKKELVKKTKEIISRFNVSEIVNHCRIDDYDEEINTDNIDGHYSRLIINGKNYYGFPKTSGDDNIFINGWEDILATYLNTILPQPSEDSLQNASPDVVGRMFRTDITPSKIDINFYYSIVEYTNKKGNETITL